MSPSSDSPAAYTRATQRKALLAHLAGRCVVDVSLGGQTFGDGSESLDRITLALDDGRFLTFIGVWCNDSTADIEWEIEEGEGHAGR